MCFPRVAMCKDSHQGIDDQNPLTTLKKSNPLSPESFLAVVHFDLERPRNFESQLWRDCEDIFNFCNVPLCAFHNVNMFVDVVQFSPEIHPDGTQTFAISMQCLAAHCCTLLHLPASCWGWRSFLVSQHQNLWRHQAPLSEMIWNVRAVLRCLRCSFLSARWYVMTCYDFKMVRPCNKSVLQFTCNNLERVQSVSVFHSCKRYFQSYLSNVWATWMQGVLARCSLSGQNCGRILHMLRKMGQGWARMRYADLWWLY